MNCDHQVLRQGDHVSDGRERGFCWCARCGALSTNSGETWQEPRSMLALRLLTRNLDTKDVNRIAVVLIEGGELP